MRDQDILDNLLIGFYRTTPEGQFVYVNPALVQLLGYPDGESLLAVNARDLYVDPSERQLWQNQLEDTGVVRGFEARLCCYDETIIWIKDYTRAVRDTNDRIVYYEGSIEDITQRVQTDEALRCRAQELEALQATVLEITAHRDLSTLLEAIVERAVRLLNALSGGMYLCDPDQTQVLCVVSYNTPRDYTGTVLKYGEGAAGTVAQTGEPLIINDYRTWKGQTVVYEEEQPFTAIISAPMIWQGQVTGVIHILDDMKSRRFTQHDLELLTLFANHAAIVVENTRLYEQAQQEIAERKRAEAETNRHLQEMSLLNHITTLIASAVDSREALNKVCAELAQFLQVSQAGFALLNSQRTAAQVVAEYHPPHTPSAIGVNVPVPGNPSMEFVLDQGSPLAITDAQADPLLAPMHQVMRQRKVQSILIVPIVVEAEVIGTLGFDAFQRREFSEADIGLVQHVANQVGQVLTRKQAQDALRESEERFRGIFDHAVIGLYQTTPDGRILLANPALLRMLGYSSFEELAQRNLEQEGYEPEYPRTAFKQRIEREGQIIGWESAWVKRDGTSVYVSESARAIRDPAGNILHYEGTVEDITDRKRAEDALWQRHRELELLNRASRVFSSSLDLDQVLATVLEAVRSLMDVTACSAWLVDHETGGLVCRQATGPQSEVVRGWRLSPGEGLAGWVARHGESLIVSDVSADDRHFKGVDLETGLVLRSILSIPLQTKAKVIGVLQVVDTEVGRFDSTDLPLLESLAASAAVAIENAQLYEQAQQDIARWVRAEEELRESERRYRLLADNVTDVIWTTDMNLRFTYFSPSIVNTGYTVEEAMALSVEEFLTPTSQEEAMSAFSEALRAQDTVPMEPFDSRTLELEVKEKDGSAVWTEVRMGFLRDAEGRPVGILGVARDIAERKRAEEALRQYAERLHTLHVIDRAILEAQSPEEIAQAALRHIRQLVPCQGTGVVVFDWEVSEATLFAADINGGFALQAGKSFRLDAFQDIELAIAALRQGEILIIDDIQRLSRTLPGIQALQRLRVILNVPLIFQEELIGFISLGTDNPKGFDEQQAQIIREVAGPLAIAIQNARLYEQERTSRERAEALRETAQVLGVRLERDEILRLILDQLKRVLTYDTASVLILREGNLPDLVVGVGYDDERMTSREAGRLLQDSPILRRLAHSLEPLVSADVRQLDGWIWVPGAEHVRSWLAAPLVARGQMIGALMVDSSRVGAFGQTEVQIVQALAQHAAQAIENARLFEALERHADELEGHVAERTAELSERVAEVEQLNRAMADLLQDLQTTNRNLEETTRRLEEANVELAEANKRLKELDRLKDEFVSNVSHELRTPLSNLNLYLNLLQRGIPEKHDQYLDVLHRETARLRGLIEDLLDISRLDQVAAVTMESVDLEALAADVITNHLPRAEVKHIELALDVRPNLPPVRANAAQIVQVLTNLLGNALTYTPAGGHVAVSLSQVELADRPGLAMVVSDDGPGIPSEDQPHLFERFYRGRTGRETGAPGTGLGLSICKKIVDLHGGQIMVQSHVGQGSTFTVWLPIA